MRLIEKFKRWYYSKFSRFQPLLTFGDRIILNGTTGAKLGGIPSRSIHYYNLNQYVSVLPAAVLVYFGECKDKVYFIVSGSYFVDRHQAPDGAIVYFTRQRFISGLNYRLLPATKKGKK